MQSEEPSYCCIGLSQRQLRVLRKSPLMGPWQSATGVSSDAATDCTALYQARLSALPAASTESLNIFDERLNIILELRKHRTFLDAIGYGHDP